MGPGRMTSTYSFTRTCTKLNNKLVNALLGHFWCYDSPRPRLGGSHHLPPYGILCAFPQGPHPNGILSQDSQMGVLKLPKLGLLQLCEAIILCANFWLGWGLKQSCSPHWELSNSMSHATYTQGNRGESWVLMVGSQFGNLTPSPSFDHNLCFKCPNGSCEPISNI
jgi:hypothetical protein